MNVTNIYLSRHEDVKKLAERIGMDIGSLDLLTTTDKENIVEAINELKQGQSNLISRIEVLEEFLKKPLDQGPASEYSGTGWYKATDTGVVYNVGVPDGETYTFDGDPTEYISVWQNDGYIPNALEASEEDIQKLIYWHNNLHRFATSNVTDMSQWMTGFGSTFLYSVLEISPDTIDTDSVDLSHYDTSNVTNMQGMFASSETFNKPLDNFNTSKVTNMTEMFYEASSFNQDISSWDTSNVTDMDEMFNYASSFNQDLSQWCVSKIGSMPTIFDGSTPKWTLPKPVWGTCPRGENGS